MERGVLDVGSGNGRSVWELQCDRRVGCGVGGVAAPSRFKSLFGQIVERLGGSGDGIVVWSEESGFDIEISGAEWVGKPLDEPRRFGYLCDDVDVRAALQLIEKLPASAAGWGADRKLVDVGFSVDASVEHGGLFGVDRVEQAGAGKLQVGAEVDGATRADGRRTNTEAGDARPGDLFSDGQQIQQPTGSFQMTGLWWAY